MTFSPMHSTASDVRTSVARSPLPLFLTCWAANVVFLGATFARYRLPESRVLNALTLTGECNLAAWWSGIQLLVAALLLASAAHETLPAFPKIKVPVLAIALACLALSADELGSIHEQIGAFGKARFGSPELALLPFALLGGGAVFYGLIALFRSREMSGNAWLLLIAGFGIFGLVWVQEHIEHHSVFETAIGKGVRAVLEEGTELLGFSLLCLGAIFLRRSLHRTNQSSSLLSPLLPTPAATRQVMLVLLAASVPTIALRIPFSYANLGIPARGDFALAIPILALATGALISIRLSGTDSHDRRVWLLIATILALASAAIETSYPDRLTLGHRVIAWRADIDMLLVIPLLGFGFQLLPAPTRWKSIVLLGTIGFAVAVLFYTRVSWSGWFAPYLLAVPMMIFVLRKNWPPEPILFNNSSESGTLSKPTTSLKVGVG